MNILLTGASGFIGKHLRYALEQNGHSVKPASRYNGVDFNAMITPDKWLPHLHNIDVVINSVGIIAETANQSFQTIHHLAPKALFQACERVGIKRVIQISALGVDQAQAATGYQQSKKAADDALQALDMDWFILRPSLVYGEGGTSLAMFQKIAAFPVIPLVQGGRQMIQPVHISDVVATVLKCLEASDTRKTLDVVGAEPVSFAQWLQAIRANQGKTPARIVSVPYRLSVWGAQLARFISPVLHPDNLKMLQQGNTANSQPLSEFLSRKPLSIEEGLCCI